MLALAVITAVTAGAASPKTAAQRQEAAEYRALLEAAPVAQVEGETLSPNGQFQVRDRGTDVTMYISGCDRAGIPAVIVGQRRPVNFSGRTKAG